MSKVRPISGFPEWLPSERIVEQHFLDVIRETFELYGTGRYSLEDLWTANFSPRRGDAPATSSSTDTYQTPLRRIENELGKCSASMRSC